MSIGYEPVVREALGGGADPPDLTEVVHTPFAMSMEEFGPVAIRKKRDASILRRICRPKVEQMSLKHREYLGDYRCRKHLVGILPGLGRPAFAVPFPGEDGSRRFFWIPARIPSQGLCARGKLGFAPK